ncbi:hypothetical protein, partial [Microcystis sp. M018S1]|uniref:hypothetical protein n=1 Tax=Microcystis sp. M018S1 TaxID=2771108 RepID=UPI0025866C8C
MSINQLNALFRVCGKKFVGGVRVWGVGCGVWWGFTDFEGVNYLGSAEKVFRWGLGVGGWGLGVGVWGFTHFQVVNYLIFREKVPEFSPQSLQGSALF